MDLSKIKTLLEEVYFCKIDKIRQNKTTRKQEILYAKKDDIGKELEIKMILSGLYNSGYGFKAIVKMINCDKLSYTKLRRIMKDLKIETRKGTSVITEQLRKTRAANAERIGNFKNWTVTRPDLLKNSKRFVGGWYYNSYKNRYVYLRSSWEYAYAKYLDTQKIDWDVEVQQYNIEDKKYLPDFFIYENEKLKKIVEIKSLYNHDAAERIKKYYKFKELYSHIETELYTEIKEILALLQIKSYRKILKEWKDMKEKNKNVYDRI